MINELNEMTDKISDGRDTGVIEKQIQPKIGFGTLLFQILIWFLPPLLGGIIFLLKKVKAKQFLDQLQQRIQADASTIDNYLEQRVQIMQNLASIVEKSAKLDHDTQTEIAGLRSGAMVQGKINEESRNMVQSSLDKLGTSINVSFERYPELQAQENFARAIKENSTLQKEITAAREKYNSTVSLWNTAIFEWPVKMIVAAKNQYTTRIPFAASSEIKAQARSNFFK